MANSRRVTVYFEPELFNALRVKGAAVDRSLSELVNLAVRRLLADDLRDLQSASERAGDPALSFESVLQELRRRGRI